MKLSLWILGIVLLSLSWAQKKDPQKMQVRRFLERLNELEKQLEIENLRIQKRELLFRAYLKRGEEKFQQERYEDALRFFQGAQLLDPLSAKSFIGFAKIERVRKNLDLALHALEEALMRDDIPEIHQERAQIFYSKAVAVLEEKKYSEARALLDETIKEDPKFGKAYYQQGQLLIQLGEIVLAEKSFRQSLEYPKTLGEYQEEASKKLEQILEERKSQSTKIFQKGEDFQKNGQWLEAQEHFARATELEPENAKFWKSLGSAYLQNGSGSSGIEAYFQVIRIDSSDHETLEVLIRFLQQQYTQTLFSDPQANQKYRKELQKALKIALSQETLAPEKKEAYKKIQEVVESSR
ncbi:MAG: tetratricopeptide repeat protein [Planctomycetota bacterium]